MSPFKSEHKKMQVVFDRLLRTCLMLNKSLTVGLSVGVKGWPYRTDTSQVKINGIYYQEVLLKQHQLQVIKAMLGDTFDSQQDRAAAALSITVFQ